MILEMTDEAVLARTGCRLHPWWAIRTPPQIFEYRGVRVLDLVEKDLGHQPKVVRGAWMAGRLVVWVFGSSRGQRT